MGYVVLIPTMGQIAASAFEVGLDDSFSSGHIVSTYCSDVQVGCGTHVGSLSSLFSEGFWCCLACWCCGIVSGRYMDMSALSITAS